MDNLWIVFMTGLTAGGLSCLAVQGGLLTSSLAYQVESDLTARGIKPENHANPRFALPIILFLSAKLAAYSLLGALLGALGSVFQLTPLMRAILLFIIGIFMVGNALRMLNIHPVFRYFSFEPPAFLSRYIRRKARNTTGWFTPLFLGTLTIFIPCGITQSMMALAISSGDPVAGAAILFSFTLGASPVFFAVAYFAAQLGSRLERWFMRIVAIVLLVLGILSIDSGLNLAGSPISLSRLARLIAPQSPAAAFNPQPLFPQDPFQPALPATEDPAPIPTQGANSLVLAALNNGYSPEELIAPANQAIMLSVITKNTLSCSRAFVIPSLQVEEFLPQTGTVVIQIPPQTSGTVIQFTCSMGMYTGEIRFQ